MRARAPATFVKTIVHSAPASATAPQENMTGASPYALSAGASAAPPTTAPSLPAAAEMPWHVARTSVRAEPGVTPPPHTHMSICMLVSPPPHTHTHEHVGPRTRRERLRRKHKRCHVWATVREEECQPISAPHSSQATRERSHNKDPHNSSQTHTHRETVRHTGRRHAAYITMNVTAEGRPPFAVSAPSKK